MNRICSTAATFARTVSAEISTGISRHNFIPICSARPASRSLKAESKSSKPIDSKRRSVRPRSSLAYASTFSTRCVRRIDSARSVFRYSRRFCSSTTMPSASISAYIWKVVSGVRNSCVTAETKVALRSLNRITPPSKPATAAAANNMHAQAAVKDISMGDMAPSFSSNNGPGTRRTGNAANKRPPSLLGISTTETKSAAGNRSAMASKSEVLMAGQSNRQP